MTVQFTADIIIALYYSLLERGFNKQQSLNILHCIDADIIQKHKGIVVQTLSEDIWNAYEKICAKVKMGNCTFDLLLKAIECHHEVDQPIY